MLFMREPFLQWYDERNRMFISGSTNYATQNLESVGPTLESRAYIPRDYKSVNCSAYIFFANGEWRNVFFFDVHKLCYANI